MRWTERILEATLIFGGCIAVYQFLFALRLKLHMQCLHLTLGIQICVLSA